MRRTEYQRILGKYKEHNKWAERFIEKWNQVRCKHCDDIIDKRWDKSKETTNVCAVCKHGGFE